MIVPLPEGKKLISTAEAARILGVTMGRVRQLASLGSADNGLDAYQLNPRALVFDEAQVKKLAKRKPKDGKTGRPRGGFKAN